MEDINKDKAIQAIENIINRNKELEEKIDETLNANLALVQGNANSIPVSLVEETIKKLKENGYWNYLEERDLEKTIEILQELLGGNRNVSIL